MFPEGTARGRWKTPEEIETHQKLIHVQLHVVFFSTRISENLKSLGPFQTEPLYFILFYFILINNSFEKAKIGALFKRALDAVLRSN